MFNTICASVVVTILLMCHAGVHLVLEAVCVLKGVLPVRNRESTAFFEPMLDDYWPASQKMMGDDHFLYNIL